MCRLLVPDGTPILGPCVGAWIRPLPSVVAGVVEHGEDIEAAAAREVLEETGRRPGPLQHLLTVEPSNGLADGRHHEPPPMALLESAVSPVEVLALNA
ncbi:NUDIX domain-containing protein [Streptomyces sp. NBC_01198]|nr:NUDIX domain-containing protein [Streptomyces sp. NBC_01198]